MKKIFFLAATTCLLFFACKPENGGEDEKITTVEEDKANIRASFARIKNLTQNFRNGNFYHFAEDFFGIGPREKYNYIHVGEGNGDYIAYYYEYTPGTGTHDRYPCEYPQYDGFCYQPASGGVGDYTVVYEYKYVGQGNGAYKQGNPYTEFDMVIPEFTQLLGDEFDRIVNLDQIEEEKHFKMSTFAGKYTWNKATKKWDKTFKNDIQVLFPSVENGSMNCELAITEYTDVACDIEGSTTWLPTKISSSFKKDGVKIAGVDASGSFNAYGIPKSASVNVYAKPISLTTTLKQVSSSNFAATLSINDETNSENSLSIIGDAVFANEINAHTDVTDSEFKNVIFTIIQYKLSIKGSVNIEAITSTGDNVTTTEINSNINAEVFYNGEKIGTLKIEEIDGMRYLYIFYKDGTKENTEIYYDDFLTDIEHIFTSKR